MGSLSFVMCFSKFIIQQSILYVILFYKKLVKWCYINKSLEYKMVYINVFIYYIFVLCNKNFTN